MRLLFILSILLPCTLQGDDLYSVRFDDRLQTVEVEACFDGPAPAQLYRSDEAARFTDWIRSSGQKNGSHKIGRWSYGSRLRLPDLPDDDCIHWRVDLNKAADKKDYRLAMRLEDSIITDSSLWFWRDGENRPIQVEVLLPDGMSISTPWKEQENSREVPGGNQGEHPDRYADGLALLAGQLRGDGLAGEPPPLTRHVVGQVDRLLDVAQSLG